MVERLECDIFPSLQVGFEFAVPFITIPVRKSLENMRNLADAAKAPITRFNLGGISAIITVISAAVVTGLIYRAYAIKNTLLAAHFNKTRTHRAFGEIHFAVITPHRA